MFIYLIILFGFYRLYNYYLNKKKIIPYNKWVLITGCDSGFGYLATTKLLNEGYNVIATCLTDYGLNGIKNIADRMHTKKNNIVYVKCDVTKDNDINNLKEIVENHCHGELWALINNAGIQNIGILESQSINNYKNSMDIMFYGPVKITNILLPYLKKSQGRIINISSCLGIIAGANQASYNSAKWALEAFSDSLRIELSSWNIKVSVIQPGIMKTKLTYGLKEGFVNNINNLSKNIIDRDYGENWINNMATELECLPYKVGNDPELVVNAIYHSISSSHPKIRYRPDIMSKCFYILKLLPVKWVDNLMISLNLKHKPKYLENISKYSKEWKIKIHSSPKEVYDTFLDYIWKKFAGSENKNQIITDYGDKYGKNCTRKIGDLTETITNINYPNYIEYQLSNFGWKTFPVNYHFGKIYFISNNLDTEVVWKINWTPKKYANLITNIFFNSIVPYLLKKLKTEVEKIK